MRRNNVPCGEKCEVYSRPTGFFTPLRNWNAGKLEEFKNRKTYKLDGNMRPKRKNK